MRIHHVAFRTLDPASLARWYLDVFELPTAAAPRPDAAWLQLDDGMLMIERASAGEPTVPRGSLEFIALRVTAAERDAFVRRCERLGVAIEQRTEWTVYVRDPDGRRVGVSCFDGFP